MIYVLRAGHGKYIKIGFSTNLKNRLHQSLHSARFRYGDAEVVGVMEGDSSLDMDLRAPIDQYRARGVGSWAFSYDWFHATPEVVAHIAALPLVKWERTPKRKPEPIDEA